ncbi:MAG TPA: DHA2 family efflux MFS transporter permease subunit [Acidimicrobiales bacterium]|nr:DHA2 family efflux MFS transporter permease subunit [Acidimicrobiales bacterium]
MKRIALVIVLGSVMSVLDTTIVNVALADLSRDLHTGLNDIQWVVSAYLLALAAVIPLGGWAVRRYSAYRVYLWALLLFTLGSALCAAASSAPELVAFRALQGAGGGLVLPTGMTILIRATDRARIPHVMSAIGTPMVLAPVFGPTLGGFLLQNVSWHAIFMINVPIGVATGLVAIRLLPRDEPARGGAGRLDWVGLLLAGTGTVGVTYGLSQSATAGSIASLAVLLPVLTGCALLGVFVLHAQRVPRPLLDLKLYGNPAYTAATVVLFCLGAALFGAMILLPLYFQDGRHLDAMSTGLLLIPQGAGAALGMNRSAVATERFGAGLTSLLGVGIVALCTCPFLFVGTHTSYLLISAAMATRGVGVGLAIMPAMSAAFSALEKDQIEDASPQLNVIQRIGGSLGTALVAVVLQGNLTRAGSRARSMATAFDRTYLWVILISMVAVLPAFALWRVERRVGGAGRSSEQREQAMLESLA